MLIKILFAVLAVLPTACFCRTCGPKVSVFHVHLVEMAKERDISLEDVVREVVSWGVTGVDLWFGNQESEGRRLLSAGMRPSSVIVFMDYARTNDCERAERAIAYAKSCRSPLIMLVPGFLREGQTRESAWSMVREGIGDFLARAERAGIRVAVEDFDSRQAIVGSRAHLRRLLAGFPRLGHVLDTGNYVFWGDNVLDAQDEFAARIKHVHVKDRDCADKTASVAAGRGVIPIRQVIQRLLMVGYDGWLSIECFGSADMMRDLRFSAEFIRNAWLGDSCRRAVGGDTSANEIKSSVGDGRRR